MSIDFQYPEFEVERSEDCVYCGRCVKECPNGVHILTEDKKLRTRPLGCVACHRCAAFCPTGAIQIVRSRHASRANANWSEQAVTEITKQAATGGVLLSSMGNPENYPVYFDRILINASQVTNPSLDPLREPMETRTFLGAKPDTIHRDANGNILPQLPPQLSLSTPILFSAMSYGSISYNAHASLARAAEALGIFYNTGEGGMLALNDRLKLRSMVVGEKDDMVYIASEEAAIRAIQPELERLYAPKGGEGVLIQVKEGAGQCR